jgi:hypothetical protein
MKKILVIANERISITITGSIAGSTYFNRTEFHEDEVYANDRVTLLPTVCGYRGHRLSTGNSDGNGVCGSAWYQ